MSKRRRIPEAGLAWPYQVALFLLGVAIFTLLVLARTRDDPRCSDGEIELGSYRDWVGKLHRTCVTQLEDGSIVLDLP